MPRLNACLPCTPTPLASSRKLICSYLFLYIVMHSLLYAHLWSYAHTPLYVDMRYYTTYSLYYFMRKLHYTMLLLPMPASAPFAICMHMHHDFYACAIPFYAVYRMCPYMLFLCVHFNIPSYTQKVLPILQYAQPHRCTVSLFVLLRTHSARPLRALRLCTW